MGCNVLIIITNFEVHHEKLVGTAFITKIQGTAKVCTYSMGCILLIIITIFDNSI